MRKVKYDSTRAPTIVDQEPFDKLRVDYRSVPAEYASQLAPVPAWRREKRPRLLKKSERRRMAVEAVFSFHSSAAASPSCDDDFYEDTPEILQAAEEACKGEVAEPDDFYVDSPEFMIGVEQACAPQPTFDDFYVDTEEFLKAAEEACRRM